MKCVQLLVTTNESQCTEWGGLFITMYILHNADI